VPNEKDVKIISMGAMENGSQRSNGYHEYIYFHKTIRRRLKEVKIDKLKVVFFF
jgi:hypothetical protein